MLTTTLIMDSKGNSPETHYICPSCGKKDSFMGSSAPISCGECHVLLPDITELRFSELERKRYHLGRGQLFNLHN